MCFKEAYQRRMADPEKAAHDLEARLAREAIRRPKKEKRPTPSAELRRERGRLSKAKQRVEDNEAVRAAAREFYRKNSLRVRLRNRVSKALRQQKVNKVVSVEGYGIDVDAIAKHLGPCPGDMADWHIDHIRPLCLYDLHDPTQLLAAFHPTNHQWLTANENMRKGAKYA